MIDFIALVGDRKPDFTIGSETETYLERWFIRPRTKAGPNVYLHHMLKGDMDRHIHDHPWDNTSILLSGGYWEQTTNNPDFERMLYRPQGTIIHRDAEDAHKLVLFEDMPDVWTLFITGNVRRTWGFHTEEGWVPFHDYLVRYRPDQYAKYAHQYYEDE